MMKDLESSESKKQVRKRQPLRNMDPSWSKVPPIQTPPSRTSPTWLKISSVIKIESSDLSPCLGFIRHCYDGLASSNKINSWDERWDPPTKNPKKLTPKQQPTQVTHLTAQIKLLLNPQGIEAGPLSFCRIKLSRIKLSLTVLAWRDFQVQLPRWPNKKAVKSLFKGNCLLPGHYIEKCNKCSGEKTCFRLVGCMYSSLASPKQGICPFVQKTQKNITEYSANPFIHFQNYPTTARLHQCVRMPTAKRVRGTGEYACKYQTPLDDGSFRILAQFHKVWQKTSRVTPLHTILPVASLSFTLRAKWT